MENFDIRKCDLCPRNCGADRTAGAGFCGEGQDMRISKIMLHKYEEPCISGSEKNRGSGAIFFSGCSLHCLYCQNKKISGGGSGRICSPKELSEEMKVLERNGAYNINFVTPTHFYHKIKETLDIYRPNLPLIYNTSGYEKAETVKSLTGYADVFLTDFKYGTEEKALAYSKAADYPSVAAKALYEMVKTVGECRFSDSGMIEKGVIVRHLVLPGGRHDSVRVLRLIKDTVGTEGILLSLMSQYTPEFAPEDRKELKRRVTSFEYDYVQNAALELGFSGFSQERASAKAIYTPDF